MLCRLLSAVRSPRWPRWGWVPALLAAGLGLAGSAVAQAAGNDPVREREIAECRAGDVRTWGDSTDRPAAASPMVLVYDHDDAPPWFTAGQVLAVLQQAVDAWAGCGVPGQVLLRMPGATPPKGAVLVQWSEAGSRGNFGLAHYALRRLWLGPQAFRLLRSRNPLHPANETLQMVVSHEMGHLYGLMDHSRRCIDVMSYYDNGKGEHCFSRDDNDRRYRGEYRAMLPTACDLQRCRALNRSGEVAGLTSGH